MPGQRAAIQKGQRLKIKKSLLLPLVLGILLLLPHLFSMDNAYVDTESLNVHASADIAARGLDAGLGAYFQDIANPAFTLLVLAGSYRLFGESPLISRLTVFLPAFLFCLLLYACLRKKEGSAGAFLPVLLVVVNPMFIVYSQYVSSDIYFLAFSAAALLPLLNTPPLKKKLLSAAMMGVALATKYVTVVLFPVVLLFSLVDARISRQGIVHLLRFNLWYFALALLVSAPVIALVFHYQGNLLSPSLGARHTFQAGLFIPRFLAYLMWLGLFLGPMALIAGIDLWQRIGKKTFLQLLAGLAALTFAVTRFFPTSSLHVLSPGFGEMNLGGIESYVPESYLSVSLLFVLLAAAVFLAGAALDLKRGGNWKTVRLLLWIILPILLMSFTRAANRYLLVILVPLSLYLAFVTQRVSARRSGWLVPAIVGMHAAVSLAAGFYANY